MTDYRRWRVEGGTYFFTVVTEQRREWLGDGLARNCLRDAIRVVRQRRPFRIDAIVLLPDHLHTVWTLPTGDSDYSTRWKLIKKRFTREYLRAGGADATGNASRQSKSERSLWQRRVFEHTVRDESDMKRCVDYAHVNPLKHGLVAKVADCPWSSFHRYVRLGEYPPDCVAPRYGTATNGPNTSRNDRIRRMGSPRSGNPSAPRRNDGLPRTANPSYELPKTANASLSSSSRPRELRLSVVRVQFRLPAVHSEFLHRLLSC